MDAEADDGRFHPFGRTRAQSLALIAAGTGTGWWDESGRPAPWPQDFLDPAAGWATAPDEPISDWRTHLRQTGGPPPF